ncbi:MAG: hypothetical protein ACRCYY_09905 [Trueperaceae bacterium]
MKRFTLLLLIVLIACSQTEENNPDDTGKQIKDGFMVEYTPTPSTFGPGTGATETLTVSVDITKPEGIANIKISVSPGDLVQVSPSSTIVADNSMTQLKVTVKNTASSGDDPFFYVYIEGVDIQNRSVTSASVQRFQWTLP